jgi:hypothetical protein
LCAATSAKKIKIGILIYWERPPGRLPKYFSGRVFLLNH